MKELTPAEFTSQTSTEAAPLIDVRTPGEYSSWRVQGSINIPLGDTLCPDIEKLFSKESSLYITCQSGARAKTAVDCLEGAGFTNITLVSGGINQFKAEGIDLEKGPSSVIPLDRQVHIVVGLLALTGTLLGHFVNPYFFFIPGFVGAGLTFAGLTGICALGMLLAKMPWNQSATTNCAGGSCYVS